MSRHIHTQTTQCVPPACCCCCCCAASLAAQVAGLRVFHSAGTFKSVVLTKPDGSAVAIKPEEKYTIVATDYILQGGDGFSMFKDAEVLLPAGQPYAAQVIEDLKLFPQGVSDVTRCVAGLPQRVGRNL